MRILTEKYQLSAETKATSREGTSDDMCLAQVGARKPPKP